MSHPKPEEIEVSIFGPGLGECIVIHLGSRNWIILDSCLDDSKNPVALTYLNEIGVDLNSEVKAIIATHWDDDHIKGMSQLLKSCGAAEFAISAALRDSEFRAFLRVHDNQPVDSLDRGGTEILKCLEHLKDSGRRATPVLERVKIIDWERGELGHGKEVEVLALSPSAKQFDEHVVWLTEFREELKRREKEGRPRRAKTRLVGATRNDLSIATIIRFEDVSLILGADVEERGDIEMGWSRIVDLHGGKERKSWALKVPHHGSKGAHHDGVWSELLTEGPISVVTPWRRGGGKLPTEEDCIRLAQLSGAAYLTSDQTLPVKRRYDRETLKLIKHSGVKVDSVRYRCGCVRLRFPVSDPGSVEVELLNTAVQLAHSPE